jgi:hypothetical protein
MLTARRTGWLSSTYVIEAEGVEVLRIKRSWRGTATLVAANGDYVVDRAWFSGRYTLQHRSRDVARAEPLSRWRGDIRITGEGASVTLRRTGWRQSGYTVSGGAGALGTIARPSWLSSSWEIDLPPSVPVLLQGFALAIVLAREADEAAGATAAVAAAS